jgi:hypothetical protein
MNLFSNFFNFGNNNTSEKQSLDKQFIGIAIIEEEVIPILGGRCKFNGVYWQCLSVKHISLKEGEIVKVNSINIDLICLIVEPFDTNT